jgi:NAD(P)-dependent dehydrogenase (short-subunit alcohol dehydrogenase family)
MIDSSLQGRVAVVTGGRRGIGRAAALALSSAGADVAVCDLIIDDGLLENTAGEIRHSGHRSLAYQMDISQKDLVFNTIRAIADSFGRIDILVNCAGVWIPGQTLVECSDENWDKVINTNLRGTLFCCQAAAVVMMPQNSGSIINLSSQVGLNPGTGVGAYSISKAGIIMLTRQLALELSPYRIRVNAIAPGVVKTDFNIDLWREPASEKRIAEGVPLGRLAEPEDIARTVLFLASDDSGYITGDVIKIDGGWQVPATTPRKNKSEK